MAGRSSRAYACVRVVTLSCLAPLAVACGTTGYQHVVERPLPSTDALACRGFLVWEGEPVRDVFLVINGSGVLSNAFVHPTFDRVVRDRRVGYATYDKPGISAPFGDPARVDRDDALLQRYTLGHGVACATEALRWARQRFGASVRLHVRGHSEGTLISLYLYDALLQADPGLAAQLETFVLSGLALEPFADILARQLAARPDRDEVTRALASCDWAVLKDRIGVSCAYVADAERRPSGREMFQRLAARAPAARFHVFHGASDRHTPVEPVRLLEAWNAAEGRLAMRFHFYEGGHAGTESARAELARLLAAIVAK